MTKGKLILFSAPSGSGKSTIIQHLMQQNLNLAFSISATSRAPRGKEVNGIEYFFLSPKEFKDKIQAGEFLEWQEVYKDVYYGTLKEVVEKMITAGKNVIFDVDVVGGCNIKNYYGSQLLSIFIMPPSIQVLRERLIHRGTDSMEAITHRIEKAEYEMGYASQFDCIIKNDDLETAQRETLQLIQNFLAQ